MERKQLIATLRAVAPALMKGDLGSIMSSFRFHNDTVTAYNEVVALEMPLVGLPINGCVPGALLLDVLTASSAKTVELDANTSAEAVLKAGRSRLRLAKRAAEDFPLDLVEDGEPMKVPAKFWTAMRYASMCADEKSGAWYTGITMRVAKDSITLYTSNEISAAHCVVKLDKRSKVTGDFRIPLQFCDLADGRTKQPTKLRLSEVMVSAKCDDGWKIMARTHSEVNIDAFEAIFKTDATSWMETPSAMKIALERASAMMSGGAPFSTMKIANGKMVITTRGSIGEVRDVVKLTKAVPDVQVTFNPKAIAKLLPSADKIAICEDRIWMRSESVGTSQVSTM